MLIMQTAILAFGTQEEVLTYSALIQDSPSSFASALAADRNRAPIVFVGAFFHCLAGFFDHATAGRRPAINVIVRRVVLGGAIGLALTIGRILFSQVVNAVLR